MPGPHAAATERTTAEARAGRHEVEWTAVRNPERAREATAALLASEGPERDRRLQEGFARTFDAVTRQDWEFNTLYLDGDEHIFRAAELREMLPDARDEYEGIDGYLEAVDLFAESWSDLRLELVDVISADPDRVVALTRWSGSGLRSGAPFEQLCLVNFRFRDGLVVEQAYWWDCRRGARELGVELPAARG